MAGIFVLSVWVFFVIGWIANVVQVISGFTEAATIAELSGLIIIKTICIFIAPIGGILGWIGMF